MADQQQNQNQNQNQGQDQKQEHVRDQDQPAQRVLHIIFLKEEQDITSSSMSRRSHDILTSRYPCTQWSNKGKGVEEAIKLDHHIRDIQIINVGLIIKGSILTRKNHVLFSKIHETSIKNRE